MRDVDLEWLSSRVICHKQLWRNTLMEGERRSSRLALQNLELERVQRDRMLGRIAFHIGQFTMAHAPEEDIEDLEEILSELLEGGITHA